MIGQDLEPYLVEPQGLVEPEILKTLRDFKAILETTPPHAASTCHDAGTIDKVINMEFTAMLMRSGFDGANELMDGMMDIIHFVLVQVRQQVDPDETLDKAIAFFDKRTSKDIVHVHRTTAEESEPRMTRVGIDEKLSENYQACMEDLERIGAKPASILLAIDSSPERCRSKYKNGLFTAVRVGGSAVWELGYKQSIVKDVTTDLFTGCIHRGKWQNDADPAGWEPWIRDIQTCVARVQETSGGTYAIPSTVTITNPSNFADFIADFIENETVAVTLTGTASIVASGVSLSLGIAEPVLLAGMNDSLAFVVDSIALLESNSTSVTVDASIQLTNPSSVNMALANLAFDVSWNGDALGALTILALTIASGNTMPIVNATITLSNVTLFDDLVDDVLGGLNVTLDLDGIPSGSILDGFIDTLTLGVEIPGLAPYEVVIVSLTLLNSTANSFGVRVEVEIFNPTRGAVSITSASFDLEYENQSLGNVAFPTLNVDSGRHRYNVSAVLTVSNTTTLSHVLSGWLDGDIIQVEFTGHTTSTDVISNIVNAYLENITLPPCPELSISIGIPRFISSTPTTLVLGVNVTITNPAPMNVTLNDIDLDVSFEGSWVGNVTSVSSVAMEPCINIVPIQVSLSGAFNKTAVEKILSLHVAKQSVDLSLNGSALVSVDGMATPVPVEISTDESMPGITQDLISGVTVSIISVVYTPTPGMSGQVLVSVRNPFSFGINVTYMKYDVHYDDNDGMYIPVPPTTFPAAINKFFQTITDNRSVAPVQLSASGTSVVTTSISSSNLEHCARLFDEYMVDDDLRVHLRNGIFHITIGAFTAQVSFSQLNIVV